MRILETIVLTSMQAENWRVFLTTAIFFVVLILTLVALAPTLDVNSRQFKKSILSLFAIVAVTTVIYCGTMASWCIVEKPTGIKEYHVVLDSMTSEELATVYDIVTYEDGFWIVQDK